MKSPAFARLALVAATSLMTAAPALAFPERPVTMVTPFPAGGVNDSVARTLARAMAPALGQSIVNVNRPGAGGTLGISAALNPPRDGHQLVVAGLGSIVLAPVVHKANIRYDTQKDLAPVGIIGNVPIMIAVKAGLPVGNLAELIAYAKARPGALSYASAGIGGTMHMAGVLLEREAGIELNHVPYKGGAAAANDLVAGVVDIAFTDASVMGPFVLQSRVKPIAVISAERARVLPDVPTTAELGYPKVRMDTWYAVFAPAGAPPAALDRLRQAFDRARAMPEVATSLEAQGITPSRAPLAAFEEQLSSDFATWPPLLARICERTSCN